MVAQSHTIVVISSYDMCFMQILVGSFLLGSWITTFYLTGEYDISPSLLREGSE